MTQRFVDLAVILDNETIADPPPQRPHIAYHDHYQGAGKMAVFFLAFAQRRIARGQSWYAKPTNAAAIGQ